MVTLRSWPTPTPTSPATTPHGTTDANIYEPDAAADWVLESGTPPSYARGEAAARSDAGGLTLENRGSHLVFWRNQVSHGP